MREAWTDERLDELSLRMDNGFNRLDADIRDLRREMRETQRLIIQVGAGMLATMVVGFISVVVALG